MAKPPDSSPTILSIDAGTSALKAALYQDDGRLLGLAVQRYEYRTPHPGWAEIDPETWWHAFIAALADLRRQGYNLRELRALGVTGQMHAPILLDENSNPVIPAILWLDQRAGAELRELQARLQLPPHKLNASFTLPKLLWLHRHQPQTLARARILLWPKDYLRFRLTGSIATDLTDAAGASLLDWEQRTWAEAYATMVGLTPDILPPIRVANADAGPIKPEIADKLGLSPRIRVIIGAGDVISLLGAAPMQSGRMVCIMGSSTMLATPIPSNFQADPQHRLYHYPFLPIPVLNGIQSTSGSALSWAWKTLYEPATSPEDAIAAALQTPPAAEGLIFLPFLAGERSPYWNDALRGGFYGLTLSHRRDHMLRSIMEGVAFSVRHLLDIAAEMQTPITELALAGGAAAMQGWAQIFADICQRPVYLYAGQSAVTRSIYALCRSALSPAINFTEALSAAISPPVAHFTPRNQLSSRYDQAYQQYLELARFVNASLAAD